MSKISLLFSPFHLTDLLYSYLSPSASFPLLVSFCCSHTHLLDWVGCSNMLSLSLSLSLGDVACIALLYLSPSSVLRCLSCFSLNISPPIFPSLSISPYIEQSASTSPLCSHVIRAHTYFYIYISHCPSTPLLSLRLFFIHVGHLLVP